MAAEKGWSWDLILGTAAIVSKDHKAFGCSLLSHGIGRRRALAGKKRGERTLADGPGEVPRGLALRKFRWYKRVQPRGGIQIGICNAVQKCLEMIGPTTQGHTCQECYWLWPVVGGTRNGAAEED